MLSAYTAAKAASSYTLSGSSDGTQPILVDDDLDVYLNGTLIYTDGTGTAGNRPPIPFSADGGNSLHIVVRDTYGDCSSLSPVYLTSAAGPPILADPGFNLGCGRPATDQGIVHDTTFFVPSLTSQFQAWGSGYFGDGQPNPPYPGQLLPLPIYLPPNISDIENSGDTAFLTTDGTVLVSGGNNYGELGQGYVTAPYPAPNLFYPTPLMVPGLANVKQIAGGSDGGSVAFFVALLADGTVRSWGYNAVGELGNGVFSNDPATCKCVPTVQTVVGLSGVTSVSAGYGHVLALKQDGTVWAWGNNFQGELGDGTFTDGRPVPLQVAGLPNIVAIAAGEAHSLALASDGTLWAWGSNAYGELGNGTIDPPGVEGIATPIQVPISGVAAIAAGGNLSFAIKTDGTVWAWGEDFAGQTGTGGTGGLIGGKS
ncbi:MAG TPA: hypothetical protein VL327_05145, partial [Pyrinomonadaceae bacterium]|nr:hypothetical protein [Pyrinomonadaceae bacterium]